MTNPSVDQDLYMERLETLYEKELTDIRAFAQRENRPLDEVRTRLAEWHCKALFDLEGDDDKSQERKERISRILRSVSRALESLLSIGGLESFFLAVDPYDPTDEGFLGGTLLGREFWRGHRGCGAAGARAFQTHCQKSIAGQLPLPQEVPAFPVAVPSTSYVHVPVVQPTNAVKKSPASTLKTEVYASVRNALRAASGVRNAEMKWTNHSKLSQYGVCVEGWPANIPMQNPSSLSTVQNRSILEALAHGTLRFVPLHTDTSMVAESSGALNLHDYEYLAPPDWTSEPDVFAGAVDFSWNGDNGEDDSSDSNPTRVPAPSLHQDMMPSAETAADSNPVEPANQPPHSDTSRKRRRDESAD